MADKACCTETAKIANTVNQSHLIEALATKHPYYCSESNYYSNDPACAWDTATDFLNEYEDGDVDMNLVFRWDIQQKTDNNDNPVGVYSASIFMMHQRKGIFAPHYIRVVLPSEAQRLKDYLEKHWKTMQAIWAPFGG